MFFTRTTRPPVKSCPSCGQVLESSLVNGIDRLVCFACEFVHWNNPIPVTATLVPMTNGLVLVQRKYPPFVDDWCLPGGFIEANESPQSSAIREVEEETGLTVKIDRMIAAESAGKGINVIILFYLAAPAQGVLNPGDDASAVKTFTKDTLPKNIAFPLHAEMIDKWFNNNL